ncbi:peptidylprolyl isomerase [Nocardioides solisilvae]|uniref:peptidylprolyl isomerase n=1 Tax=Nocardioides solisilvae TaxID=1542435 RepID=UPI000D745F1C|nr:peptidylprolyl isomerase [Nocardioides solisilvae]
MPELTRTRLSLATVVLLLPLLASCGEEGQSAQEGPTPSDASASASPDAAGACTYPTDGSEPSREVTPPPASPEVSGEVAVTLATSAGEVKAVLDADGTPCTVQSFVSLAEQGYFDDTECHRLTTEGIFVLQCGDPTGTGTGGPGYTVPDELGTARDGYPAGVLAMANTGAPDSGGSQFFIVHEDTQLPPAYAVFGRVDEAGLDVVREVAARGTDSGAGDGPPAEPVTLDSVTLD